MPLTTNYQEIEIDGTASIEVSQIQPDADTTQSNYVRIVQFYTDPPMMTNRRPILTVVCHGGNQQNNDTSPLQIAVPPDTF
jgi:hypothetical protein